MNRSEVLSLAGQWNVEHDAITSLLNNSDSIACRFLHAVQIGKSNAVHSCDLQRILNTDHRTIEDIAFRLRTIGFPIIGNNAGYYAASDLDEGKECFNLLYNRAMSTLKSLDRIHETLEKEGCV